MTTNPHRILTPTEKRILTAAKPELSAYQIADELNLHPQEIYRAVRKFNLIISPHKQVLSDEQKQEIRELASPELGAAEIARKVKSTKSRVMCFLEKENLPRKTNAVLRDYPKIGSAYFDWRDFGNSIF